MNVTYTHVRTYVTIKACKFTKLDKWLLLNEISKITENSTVNLYSSLARHTGFTANFNVCNEFNELSGAIIPTHACKQRNITKTRRNVPRRYETITIERNKQSDTPREWLAGRLMKLEQRAFISSRVPMMLLLFRRPIFFANASSRSSIFTYTTIRKGDLAVQRSFALTRLLFYYW